MRVQDLPEESISVKLLTPVDFDAKAEPCLIEIQAQQTLPSHFFVHKGEELGYLLSGKLQVKIDQTVQTLRAGDLVYLTTEFPSQWKNPGSTPARLLWIKIR
jgi:quercetin dioxygenase-like cupin family protein